MTLHFVFMDFVLFLVYTEIIYLHSVNQLFFVIVKFGVIFEVRTDS
jgi:hypothetical protein